MSACPQPDIRIYLRIKELRIFVPKKTGHFGHFLSTIVCPDIDKKLTSLVFVIFAIFGHIAT